MPTDPTDPKPRKPMPSAAEINAYLEQSAARTKLRLPLAKGAAAMVRAPAPSPSAAAPSAAEGLPSERALPPKENVTRTLPLQGTKKLPTQPSSGSGASQPKLAQPQAVPAAPAQKAADAPADDGEAWRPFSVDDDR